MAIETRAVSSLAIVIALVTVPTVAVLGGTPRTAPALIGASVQVPTVCPNPLPISTMVPIRIYNVGVLRFPAFPPQVITQFAFYEGFVKYLPSVWGTAFATDGAIWAAEGPYWATCALLANGSIVILSNPGLTPWGEEAFAGTVWKVAPGDDDEGGGGGGSSGGGDGGIDDPGDLPPWFECFESDPWTTICVPQSLVPG